MGNNDINRKDTVKINLIDFGRLKKLDPAIICYDRNNYIDRVVNRLFKKQSVDQFYRFFNGISNPEKKVKIYLRAIVQHEFEPIVSLIHWLEESKYCNYRIISILDISRMGKEYLKFSKIKIHHFPIINKYKIFLIKKTILGIMRFIVNCLILKPKVKQNQKDDYGIDLKKFQVLFFPHKSVFYGNLFLKDHFYSKDKLSSFHPRNIIHLEYDNMDIEKIKERYKEYFGFEPLYMNLDCFIEKNKEQFYKEIYNCIDKELIRSIIKAKISLRLVRSMVRLYYGYLYYCDALQEFDNVKIALVGYDALFPVALSLALESKGIKTIAVQERFMHPFYNNTTYIIDTQFTASNYILSLLKSKQEFIYVSNCIPTGLIRSDKLIKSKTKTKSNPSRGNILVFDHHVENNFNDQIANPVLNWPNDLFFRKEILKLAKDFKDYEFIVRGKNIEWTNIAYFNDILDQWNNTPNITLDADYSEFYRSYELCNKSDLIIARHTSIADECISKGFDVIIHDYGINYDCLFRNFYPKIPGINFCHSYKELKGYMVFFHENGYITNQKLKNEIIDTLFDGLSDGNVQSRITQYLNKIDYQELR